MADQSAYTFDPLENHPSGAVNLDDKRYITRQSDITAWNVALNAVRVPTCNILTIVGSRQMGKSSLLIRLKTRLNDEFGDICIPVFVDCQVSGASDGPEMMIKAIIFQVARELPNFDEPTLSAQWNAIKDKEWGEKATIIFERHILNEVVSLGKRIVVLIDEVETVSSQPWALSFFSLFRLWYNRSIDPQHKAWKSLSMVFASAIRPSSLIEGQRQSPFNIGPEITLADLTLDETHLLNQAYPNPPLLPEQVISLYEVINGHVSLTQLATYYIALGELTFDAIMAQAAAKKGIFHDNIGRVLTPCLRKPEWTQVLISVIVSGKWEENHDYTYVESLGAICHDARSAWIRCPLYLEYLEGYLSSELAEARKPKPQGLWECLKQVLRNLGS
jgi:hypothetical protein